MVKTAKRPIVGLFLDKSIVSMLKKQNTKPYYAYRLSKLVEACAAAEVTLVLFSIDDISFNPDRTSGLIFNQQTQCWDIVTIKTPDVLYDRFVGSGPTEARRARRIRDELSKRGVKKINSRNCFDKLAVYKILSRHEELAAHLPFTTLFNSERQLQEMFRRSDRLYCKASIGRRGKQVIRVSRLPGGNYAYSYFNEKLFSGKAENLSSLIKIIHKVTGNRKVIVQQAVDLIKIDDRIVDLRGELQRNDRGELDITAVLVRLGSRRSPIATHGSSYLFENFFQNRLHYTQESLITLKRKIETFLIAVYRCMELAYGPFGEIAIDFGIDGNGNIWLFECNAKSMKVSLFNSADRKTVNKAFLNPMLYARYLYSLG